MLLPPGYRETQNHQQTGSCITFFVETENAMETCPNCLGRLRKNGTRGILIRDVNVGDLSTGLEVSRKRYHCSVCGFLTEKLPEVDGKHRMTSRLVNHIIDCAQEGETHSAISRRLAISQDQIAEVVMRFARAVAVGRQIEPPRLMGIDEIRLGNSTHAVIVNLEKQTLIDILKDRKLETVKGFIAPFRGSVEAVAVDPWEDYRKAVQEGLESKVVLDRFHAVAVAHSAMEAVRKKVRDEAAEYQIKQLKDDRRLLLSSRENLTEEEAHQLITMLSLFPALREGHELMAKFESVWLAEGKHQAEQILTGWAQDFSNGRILNDGAMDHFYKVNTLATKWKTEILAWFDVGKLTNAGTESMNNKIRKFFEKAGGMSFESLRLRMLILRQGVLDKRRFQKSRPRPSMEPQMMGLNMRIPQSGTEDQEGQEDQFPGLRVDDLLAMVERDASVSVIRDSSIG